MALLYDRAQPEAGPSRPHPILHRASRSWLHIRQDGSANASASSSPSDSTIVNSTVPTPTTPTDLFPVTSLLANATSTYVPSTRTYLDASSSISTTSSAYYASTNSSFSRPWQVSTRSTTSHAAEQTPYVPGVILKMVLGGDNDDQAVYSVPMDFGHGTLDGSLRKRRPSSKWDGGSPQTVNLQVDLGSSDMWVASTDCMTSDCGTAPALFNASLSLNASTEMEFNYQMGQVSGGVYWEQVQLGGFGIGYQAFVAANDVSNEDLSGGNFTGVLGLALPANSIILNEIAGSTSGAPDGATFLDNLFGSGVGAPTQRLFSLSLERREDVRTTSTFGIGAVSNAYCPQDSCNPDYLPIISQPSLGVTGYLHWRLPLQSISTVTWSSDQNGSGPTIQRVPLGKSQIDTSRATPLAVLDSGGVAILGGYRPWIDAIYAAFDVTASADGLYRMPCTKQMALSFNFGGEEFPVHPLDMSWPDPTDPSQTSCIGALQYSNTLGQSGDFILGSSFLKNVYSIYQYPDNIARSTWQPTVGLISLTNASVASQDFYAVRVQRQSLADVSSNHKTGVGAANPTATETSAVLSPSTGSTSRKGLSTAVIAGVSVLALFVFAAGIFCAWWFWLRRRLGKDGKVGYADNAGSGHRATLSTSSLRSKKHNAAQRQKSMVEGYSDYEDSWVSTTEGGESIRLGYLPEVAEEDDMAIGPRSSRASSSRLEKGPGDTDLVDLEAEEEEVKPLPETTLRAGTSKRRDLSPSANRTLSLATDSPDSTRYPSSYGYPHSSSNWNMSGPFPSPARQSLLRPDTSPMYDIRSSDYFTVGTTKERRPSVASIDKRDSTPSGRGPSPRRIGDAPVEEDVFGDVHGNK